MSAHDLQQRPVFSDILYAQCWEDPSIDRIALGMNCDDVVFTITSGGCNALAFLLDDPKKIYALDLNPHQNHLLELKIAALQELSYGELLDFLGIFPSSQRPALYASLRDLLSTDARLFWDGRPDHIERGIIHCGTFERYIRLLGSLTRTIVGQETVHAMFGACSRAERRNLYHLRWNTVGWRVFTRLFLSRWFMSLFFDKAFFAHVAEPFSFGQHFEQVVEHALIDLPVRQSPFLSYALLGNISFPHAMPLYLREENVPIIRSRAARIERVNGDCLTFLRSCSDGHISRFNFSNIFEWMPERAFEELYREVIRVSMDGSILSYRNLLVPRSHPLCVSGVVSSRTALARELHQADLSFLYRKYVIDVISKRRHTHVARGTARIQSI